MASLYKKPVVVTDPETGEKVKVKSKKWWGRYTDEHGRDRRVPLATDKAASQAMLNKLVRKAERRAAGIEDPFEEHHKRPLPEHLEEYRKYLANKGSSDAHVNKTTARVRIVLDGCKFEKISDISASRVQEFLADLRRNGRSIATSNHYLRAIKMFTRWLVRDRRTRDDRLAHLSKMNEQMDRRRVRRPLSIEELARLIQAAEEGKVFQGISGPDRAVLYVVGAYTGYRRGEIGSITIRSFDFESDPPTLSVQAGHSKHRRKDVLPLRRDFVEFIRRWIASKPGLWPDMPLFDIAHRRTADMVRFDLGVARAKWLAEAESESERKEREASSFLKYVDDDGRYADFHSLRSTFITNLCRANVSPKMAQTLARHSTIDLTMNTYTMLGVMDQAAAVESLPPVPGSTGSEDAKRRVR